MKIFSSIMILIFLLAGFDPCSEDVDCLENEKVEISKESHKNTEDLEVCSPLCMCANCFFSVLIPVKFQLPDNFQKPGQKKIFHNSAKPVYLSYSIWQPPKLLSNT